MHALHLIQLTEAALVFARAAQDTTHWKQVLAGAYLAWREETGTVEFVERRSPAWNAMMTATSTEYMELRNAKSRERRAKAKLIALAQAMEGCK